MAAYIEPPMLGNSAPDSRYVGQSSGNSPLRIFVNAKKKMEGIFQRMQVYVHETEDYIHKMENFEGLVDEIKKTKMEEFVRKVDGIKDILSRDHMKVVFFGRTSNGKSSVINAILREKILPFGIGHTTSCFLQVAGTSVEEPFLIIEDSSEKRPIESVSQLASALSDQKLSESQMIRIYWPRNRCHLLRNDVVFVDSPGVDITPNLDKWIDQHCLDADVFVLVANSESTLMVTEKKFFHKVSEKLSKPNIFILNNRWDASTDSDFIDEVRKQHQERAVEFLVNELKVCGPKEAEERIFFISAKEVLQLRLTERSLLNEGFHSRYSEFEEFECKFKECISQSAIKTKFGHHSQRAKHIINESRNILECVCNNILILKETKEKQKQTVNDKLNSNKQQYTIIINEMKQKIRKVVDEVEQKVSTAISEEIQHLSILVDEFNYSPFNSEPTALNVYKEHLYLHVENGIDRKIRTKLSAVLMMDMDACKKEMTERVEKLVPESRRSMMPQKQPFEIFFKFYCQNFFTDFHEDLQFRFSLGITTMIQRFAGISTNFAPSANQLEIPSTNNNQHDGRFIMPTNPLAADDWSLISRTASIGSTKSCTLLVAGLLFKTVGWRIMAVTGAVYGCLYVYERLTWTNKSIEKAFKKQYVDHATKILKMIVDLTSASCSRQVQHELSVTLSRLCLVVDGTTKEMDKELEQLEAEVVDLKNSVNTAKLFQNEANRIGWELQLFDDTYINTVDSKL